MAAEDAEPRGAWPMGLGALTVRTVKFQWSKTPHRSPYCVSTQQQSSVTTGSTYYDSTHDDVLHHEVIGKQADLYGCQTFGTTRYELHVTSAYHCFRPCQYVIPQTTL